MTAHAPDGKKAEDRPHRVGITANRNAVPFGPRPPMASCGVRIGNPALAARRFGSPEFTEVAGTVATAFLPGFDDQVAAELRRRVQVLTDRFPLCPADPQLMAEEAAQ